MHGFVARVCVLVQKCACKCVHGKSHGRAATHGTLSWTRLSTCSPNSSTRSRGKSRCSSALAWRDTLRCPHHAHTLARHARSFAFETKPNGAFGKSCAPYDTQCAPKSSVRDSTGVEVALPSCEPGLRLLQRQAVGCCRHLKSTRISRRKIRNG